MHDTPAPLIPHPAGPKQSARAFRLAAWTSWQSVSKIVARGVVCTQILDGRYGQQDLGVPREIGIVIAEQPAPVPHLAHQEGYAALRIVLFTMPRVSRSCEHFPDGFDLHLLRARSKTDP